MPDDQINHDIEAQSGNRTLHSQLYQAALTGNWDSAQQIFHNHEISYNAKIAGRKTALHVAVTAKSIYFVEQLVPKLSDEDLLHSNKAGNTALCLAAMTGEVKLAQVMMNRKPDLAFVRGREELLPIHMAALQGHKKMVWYLYEATKEQLKFDDKIELLVTLIQSYIYDVALDMVKEDAKLATARSKNEETALHAFAKKSCMTGNTTHQRPPGIWNRCINLFSSSEAAQEKSRTHETALELVQHICQELVKLDNSIILNLIRNPWRLISTAAEKGNYDFLITFIRLYPDLMFKVDHNRYSIFHIAILHRHERIFKLIHEIDSVKNFITMYPDDEGNNILHLAAKLPLTPSRLHVVPGAALQMQRELLWFEEVKKVVQPWQLEAANNVQAEREAHKESNKKVIKTINHDKRTSGAAFVTEEQDESNKLSNGFTPRALFLKEHKELMEQGEKWMSGTADKCMLVATLIATVVFAAAFTVPGGNGQDTGIPIFLNRFAFKIFAISDAVSLVCSLSSVLTFLSIMTSRYAVDDFLWSLPNKLFIGLATLLMSMVAMLVAFTASLFLVFNHGHGLIWFVIPIAFIASVPVILFLSTHWRLLRDVLKSTYMSRSLFQANKNPLFPKKLNQQVIKLKSN